MLRLSERVTCIKHPSKHHPFINEARLSRMLKSETSNIPSKEGRLGDIVSVGLDVTAALPLDEVGRDKDEGVTGLELELDMEELCKLSASSRFVLEGIGIRSVEAMMCDVDVKCANRDAAMQIAV